MTPKLFFVFDVESIGLFGEAYAVGYSVVERSGIERAASCYYVDPLDCSGDADGHAWVKKNAPSLGGNRDAELLASAAELREVFVGQLQQWQARDAVVAADCPFPVEAKFLLDCRRQLGHGFRSPYPLIDVASVVMAAGMDPTATFPRMDRELPIHDPLADARQSARILINCLNTLEEV